MFKEMRSDCDIVEGEMEDDHTLTQRTFRHSEDSRRQPGVYRGLQLP